MRDKIPCLDLKEQHQTLKKEIFEAFEKVYDQTAFSGGSFVEEFEKKYASFCDTSYSIGVSNGTTALHLAMIALGIQEGDEVIVPANTFIATVWGISYVNAIPVFVDCDPHTWEIDVAKIEAKITSRTKAIAGVHLYGQPFDIDAVLNICKKHQIHLIEDAAQAQGASYKGKRVGGFGDLACFSFYPGKNLGACGEAGGITTNNETYAKHLQSLRNHGSKVRYYHDEIGFNYRMGGLEAVSLSVKLNYLEAWNKRRVKIANRYLTEIINPKINMQHQPEWAESVFHLFVVTTEHKDTLVKHLGGHNITAAFHYPVPCHLQKAYAYLGHKEGDFPQAEYLAAHCVSLPMFPELTDEEVTKVIETINTY